MIPSASRSTSIGRTRRALAAALLGAGAALASAAQDPAPPTISVGLTQLEAGALPVTLAYPSTSPAAALRTGSFELQVAADGEPAPGRRPLVVMSHGSAGSTLADHALAATLVRAGFVVAQPLHAGDNHLDSSRAGPEAWQTRTAEVSQVIDMLAAHPGWQHRLMLDRVAVHGMSAGGGTALAMAGGRWSTLQLVRHCQQYADDDPGFCFSGLPDPDAQAARRARFESARGVPSLFLPATMRAEHGGRKRAADPRPDPRVASVSVAVPVAAPFLADSLAAIRVPVGVVSAGHDSLLWPPAHSDRLLHHCKACQPLTHLAQAAHFDLLAPWPADVAARVAALQAHGGEPSASFDPADRQRAFDAIAAFHLRVLAP